VRNMDERKCQIAVGLLKIQLRQRISLKDVPNLKREIGNLVKEPEMSAIGVKSDELLNFLKVLLQQVFEEQLKEI